MDELAKSFGHRMPSAAGPLAASGRGMRADESTRSFRFAGLVDKRMQSFLNATQMLASFILGPGLPCIKSEPKELRVYFPSTLKPFSTLNTPDTPLARTPAMFLSASLATTPSKRTFPFFTMM